MTNPTDDRFEPTDLSPESGTGFGTEAMPIDDQPSSGLPRERETARETSRDLETDSLPEKTRYSEPADSGKVKGSFAGGTWIALILGALLLILLLIFIMQNQQSVDLKLFVWNFSFPAGVGFLLAAITGALIMAIVGGVRMFELRRQIKHR